MIGEGTPRFPLFIILSCTIFNVSEVIKDSIKGILLEKFEEEAFSDCFLVDLKFEEGKNKLEVFIDCDSGINFRKCQQISRYLEGYLDEENWLGEKYILEVSSPGVGKPLKLKRQYVNNIGRKLEVIRIEGKPLSGILQSVEEKEILLVQEPSKKKSKKKPTEEPQEMRIPFEHIKKAVVIVSFKK